MFSNNLVSLNVIEKVYVLLAAKLEYLNDRNIN